MTLSLAVITSASIETTYSPAFSEIDLRPVQLIPLPIPSNSGSAMRLRNLSSWRLIRYLALDVEREGFAFGPSGSGAGLSD
jgi:hypothetical protein